MDTLSVSNSNQIDLFGERFWRGSRGQGIKALHAEARRELKIRERVYPKWICQGRIGQLEANYRLDCLRDLVELLELLADKEGRPVKDGTLADQARRAVGA